MRTRECINWIWKASSGVRLRVAGASLSGVLHVAASMGFVLVCKELVDVATSDSDAGFIWCISGMVICILMQITLTAVETKISNYTDIVLKNRLRYRIFRSLMESRWTGKENFHSGDTLNRVTEDVRVVSEAITKSVPTVITACIQFLAAFAILFILEPALAWLIPVLMVVMLLFSRRYIKKMRKLTRNIRKKESEVHSLMQESLQHRVVIHTLERTPFVADTLEDRQQDLHGYVMDKTDYSIFTRFFIQLGFSTGYATAFLWGVFGIRSGVVTFGMMTAFLQLVGQVQRPIVNMARQLPSLINSLTSAERLSELTELPSEDKGDTIDYGKHVGVFFRDVDFTYPDSPRKIIDGFTYDFKPGSTTALLGETGAGKSTIMRLMLALLQPDRGEVLIYNADSKTRASSRTRCNIVYVPQGNTLLSGTIRENLLLGNPDASDQMIKEALHIAAADFVEALPDGLDTICGEGGAGLSEGQAQRIAIARAFLHEGGILLLDEPTASLDSQTEQILLKRLSERLDGRTLVIVTHRDAAAELCQSKVMIGD